MTFASLSRLRSIALACAALMTPPLESAPAAQVAETGSALQVCLDGHFEKWVKTRVDLILNEDPKAGDVDDAAVATWTVETLKACRSQTGGGDSPAEERFAKRMAQWREHIYQAAQRMRDLVKPD